jgi:hypothetical protein
MDSDDSTGIRQATLDAVGSWPRRRDRLPEDRADLLAAAWWAGNRNVAELARTSDTSRDTVYSDLRSRGIDPQARFTPAGPRPRYAPLRFETVDELASLMSTVLLPPILCAKPGPLESTAWQLEKAMTRIADLVGPDKSGTTLTPAGNAEDLAVTLGHAMQSARAYWAGLQTNAELAARAAQSVVDRVEEQALIGEASLTVSLPNGEVITVTLGSVGYGEPNEGWTTMDADSPLLSTDLDGPDHLTIQAALDAIADVLTKHLAQAAYPGAPCSDCEGRGLDEHDEPCFHCGGTGWRE